MVTKERVRRWLERRFFLRIHMSLILGGTFLAGLAATKGLLLAGLTNQLMVRYGLAVVAAYGAFLLLIRLWLAYVRGGGISIDASGVDVPLNLHLSSPGVDAPIGAGGRFGGGGASDGWGTSQEAVANTANVAKGSGSGSGKTPFGFDFDADELVVVLVLLALVAALLFAGVYIIYTAPAILTEALFEAALAGALVKGAKKIDRPGWVGAVWRSTVWPFLAILALSVLLGWAVHRACPAATRLRDAFECIEVPETPLPATTS